VRIYFTNFISRHSGRGRRAGLADAKNRFDELATAAAGHAPSVR
jgi:hypothetical protein